MFGSTISGGLFGTAATTTATSGFGTAFGSTTTASSGFGFGTTQKPTFGFGTPTTTSTTSTGFGVGFGTSTSNLFGGAKTTASSLFGTPTTTTSVSTGFGLGATGGFKLGGTTTTASGGLFGTTQSGGLFGTSTSSTGGLLGSTSTSGGLFNQPQQQAAAAKDQDLTALATAVTVPLLFNDERDSVVARWNQLQAFWGTGRGYYTQSGGHVDFNAENPFCKFKAAGYSRLPSAQDEDGLVSLSFNKPLQTIKDQQQQIVEGVAKLLGNQPTLTVCVDDVSELPDKTCQVVLYVLERAANGSTRRVSASELHRFLCTQSAQLQTAGVTGVTPKTSFSPHQLREYLETPPAGLNPVLWQQAKLDNPDTKSFLPVPLLGFQELSRRTSQQQQAIEAHHSRLKMQRESLQKLQHELQAQQAQLEQSKRNALELSHRLLKVICYQEVWRRQGQGVAAEEEQLRVALESLHAELSAPTRCKGRLNEVLSRVRLKQQDTDAGHGAEGQYQLDAALQQEIQQHLAQQQVGLEHLVTVLQQDMNDLQLIRDDLNKLTAR